MRCLEADRWEKWALRAGVVADQMIHIALGWTCRVEGGGFEEGDGHPPLLGPDSGPIGNTEAAGRFFL